MSAYVNAISSSITGRIAYNESEDSDYVPDTEMDTGVLRRKRRRRSEKKCVKYHHKEDSSNCVSTRTTARSRENEKPCVQNLVGGDHQLTTGDMQYQWGFLPAEILSKIFLYVISMEESVLPCLNNLRRVNKHWSCVANMPHLWTHMSFSPKLIPNERAVKAKYKNLLVRKCLSEKFYYTHTFHFSGLELLASHIMEAISSRSKEIRSVCAKNCALNNSLQSLINAHGKNLHNFSLEQCSVAQKSWKMCIKGMGKGMESLQIKGTGQSLAMMLRAVPFNHLANLTELQLHSVRNFRLEFIKDLIKLRVLHLTNMDIHVTALDEFIHPELEDVDLSFEIKVSHRNDLLIGKLSNCSELRRLCLRGRYAGIDTLCSSLGSCNKIFHLDISVDDSGERIHSIGSLLDSIGPSLKELHIDRYFNLEQSLAMGCSCMPAWEQLQIVSMQSTDIKGPTLLSYLLDSFREIKILNVSTCRELPRGCKRKWADIQSLKKLLQRPVEGR